VNWLKKPSTTGGIIYLTAVAIMLVGLGVVVTGPWRPGVALVGGSFGLAFVARSVLPDDRAGMLRIRRRSFDLTTMGICCVGMLLLSALVPSRH
jgi:Protein of unknown function (DUF3017)